MQVSLPPTLAEAQVLVNLRDEERRKAALRRDKHKQRSSKTKDCSKEAQFPGAVPGAELNKTALWLSTEVVCALFLRDLWIFTPGIHLLSDYPSYFCCLGSWENAARSLTMSALSTDNNYEGDWQAYALCQLSLSVLKRGSPP